MPTITLTKNFIVKVERNFIHFYGLNLENSTCELKKENILVIVRLFESQPVDDL